MGKAIERPPISQSQGRKKAREKLKGGLKPLHQDLLNCVGQQIDSVGIHTAEKHKRNRHTAAKRNHTAIDLLKGADTLGVARAREHCCKKKKPAERELLTAGLVVEDGFEPSKRNATDLQSAPFGHSGTPPYLLLITLLPFVMSLPN